MTELRNRVMLKPGSRFDRSRKNGCNPTGVTGTIIGFDPHDTDVYLKVEWENGFTNWYSIGDLYEV